MSTNLFACVCKVQPPNLLPHSFEDIALPEPKARKQLSFTFLAARALKQYPRKSNFVFDMCLCVPVLGR